MNFTFGIVTAGGEDNRINAIINSIEAQNIPEYEIIIVGTCGCQRNRTRVIPFNENLKYKWITRKKNIITEQASYENIVYLHDYIILDLNWYKGFLLFGNDFKACMTPMVLPNGQRFRDWTLWADDAEKLGLQRHKCLLPYDMINLSKYMYFSGAYWIAKKEVMKEFPLDESRSWGESEDIIWSFQVRDKYNFSINPNSCVGLLKYNDVVFNHITREECNRLRML